MENMHSISLSLKQPGEIGEYQEILLAGAKPVQALLRNEIPLRASLVDIVGKDVSSFGLGPDQLMKRGLVRSIMVKGSHQAVTNEVMMSSTKSHGAASHTRSSILP